MTDKDYTDYQKLSVVNEKISSTLFEIQQLLYDVDPPLITEIEKQILRVETLIKQVSLSKFNPFPERAKMHIKGTKQFIKRFNEATFNEVRNILHEKTSKYSLGEKFEYAIKAFNLLKMIKYKLIIDEDELALSEMLAKKIAAKKIAKLFTRKNLKKSKPSFNP
jgi:hypothetical protein